MPIDIPVLDATETRDMLAKTEPRELMDRLGTAFAGLKKGTSIQPVTVITDYPGDEGDCVFLAGLLWDLDLLGMKVSPLSKRRQREGKHPVTAYTMLLSARSGEPKMLCDAMALTAARTAATTALGVDHLAKTDARSLFVFGAGQVAIEHLRHVAHLRAWDDIQVFSPSLSQADSSRRKEFETKLPALQERLGCEVVLSRGPDAATDCDVVMCCTSANYPLLEVAKVKAGSLITSVSSDVAPAHEISPSDLSLLDVYCDYKETATVKAWELKQAVAEHGWTFDLVLGDLSEFATGSVPVLGERPRYFRNHGLAIEDLVVAGMIGGK